MTPPSCKVELKLCFNSAILHTVIILFYMIELVIIIVFLNLGLPNIYYIIYLNQKRCNSFM